MKLDNAKLLITDSCGVYIPQHFAEHFDHSVWNVIPSEMDILKSGPDHEHYWEAWDYVLCHAHFTDPNGVKYCLWQDGDLWAVPVDDMCEDDDIVETPVSVTISVDTMSAALYDMLLTAFHAELRNSGYNPDNMTVDDWSITAVATPVEA